MTETCYNNLAKANDTNQSYNQEPDFLNLKSQWRQTRMTLDIIDRIFHDIFFHFRNTNFAKQTFQRRLPF